MVAGAAVRGGLREGHDDPRREGPGVRQRVRARDGQGAPPEHADPAQPGRAREVDGLRAPRRREDAPALRRRPEALQGAAAGAGGVRGTSHRLRRADARAQAALHHGRALVRREHQREGGRQVPPRARGMGDGRSTWVVGPRRGHRRGDQPPARVSRAVREGLARTGAARRLGRRVPGRVAARGARLGRDRRRATDAARAARNRRSASCSRSSPPSGDTTPDSCWSARARTP